MFYLASAKYEVGLFVMYQADGGTWCTRIGEQAERHIVLYHVCGHYEPVEYDGLRQFPSDHEFIGRLSEFAARHRDYPYEEDAELKALAEQEQARTRAYAAGTITQLDSDTVSTPLLVTPGAVSTRLKATRAASKQRSKPKAKRAINLTVTAVEPSTVTITTNEVSGDGIKQLSLLCTTLSLIRLPLSQIVAPLCILTTPSQPCIAHLNVTVRFVVRIRMPNMPARHISVGVHFGLECVRSWMCPPRSLSLVHLVVHLPYLSLVSLVLGWSLLDVLDFLHVRSVRV